MCFSQSLEVGLQSRMIDNTEFRDKLWAAEAALPELFKATIL